MSYLFRQNGKIYRILLKNSNKNHYNKKLRSSYELRSFRLSHLTIMVMLPKMVGDTP